MYYVYILHCADGRLYTGYTHDLKQRFSSHEKGLVFATKLRRPVKLIHYEAFLDESDGKKRESYLKGGNGKKEIAVMLSKYFNNHPWVKNEIIEEAELPERPKDSLVCPVCNGVKKAATRSAFMRSGKRVSVGVEICLTCKGRGWITNASIKEAESVQS